MKKRRIVAFIAAMALIFAIIPSTVIAVEAAEGGYASAQDVVYQTYSVNGLKVVANWGLRDEVSTFLSVKADAFYTGDYIYEVMAMLEGGSGQNDANSSALYAELYEVMEKNHGYVTGYQETRDLYKYTDCERGNIQYISSFYSAKQISGTWDSGATWNREHTWPKSKCINTDKAEDSADIMMLRPTAVSENSTRENTAYGEGSGFYEPADAVKGDCARIVLYGYTRWGNAGKMWGSNGVIESLEILLKWMREDPVDTWEMGRNDAVQSITGTRNVFVDYPEYAWLLFGEEIPDNMPTPKNGMGESGDGDNTDATENNTGDSNVGENESATLEENVSRTEAESKTETERESDTSAPMPDGDKVVYTFSDYAPGEQYGENETHVLDSVLTVYTNEAYFTSQLRLYHTEGQYHGTAVFKSSRVIDSITVNAGYKDDKLKVWGSVDGENWVLLDEVSVSAAYSDYRVNATGGEYKYIKLEATSKQIRVAEITVDYAPITQVEETTVEETTVEETTVEETTVEETTAEETTVEETTVEETTVEETTVEETTVEETTVEETTAEETTVEETTVEETTVEETTVEETTVEETTVEETTVEETTVEETTAEETTVEETTATEDKGDSGASDDSVGGSSNVSIGCSSSVGGAAAVVISISFAGIMMLKRKRED